MKLKTIILSLLLGISAVAHAATPPPSSPATHTGTNPTQPYIAGNDATQSVYDQLIALVYVTAQDVFDSFAQFFNKVIATVPGFSAYQVSIGSTSEVLSGTVIEGFTSFYNGSSQLQVQINAVKQKDGTWKPQERVAGTFEIPTPPPVPIDGGASLLLAAGAAYGLKRLRKRKETVAV